MGIINPQSNAQDAKHSDARHPPPYVPSFSAVLPVGGGNPDTSYPVAQGAPNHPNNPYPTPGGYHYQSSLTHQPPYTPTSGTFEPYNAQANNVGYSAYDNHPFQPPSAASSEWQTWTQTTQHMAQNVIPPEVGALVALGSVKAEGVNVPQGGGVNWPMNLFHEGGEQ